MNILLITHKDFATTRMNFEHLTHLPFEKNIYFYNDLYKFESDAKECLEIRKLAVDNSDKIKDVYFDRGKLKYHGKAKAFAESARKNGLNF